jgi:KUP system potassium uptake protein
MPQVNGMLLVGVIVLVLLFGSSSKLATAYGIAVTGTMVVTACLAFIVVWKHWRWPIWSAALMILPFIAIDLIFFGANALKLAEGGYIPMLFGLFIMLLMWTWVRGSDILSQKSRSGELPLRSLIENLARKPPQRVPGTAVFMTSEKDVTPTALMHSLKHYKVIHEKNVIVTIRSSTLPRIDASERIKFEEIDPHFATIVMTFGYMEEPNVPKALTLCRKIGFKFDIMSTSFFVSRRALRVASKSAMPIWQDRLFIWLAANATDATEYFHIPTGRTVEIGAQYAV